MSEENLDSYGESKDKQIGRGKRGCLSRAEMKYIKQNAGKQSLEEISRVISKSEQTIQKFIDKKNLLSKEMIEKIPDAPRRKKIREILRIKEYWSELKKQFSIEELKMFEEHFISLYIQFDEDVLISEELQIKKYVTLEVLKDRMLRLDRENELQIEQLRKQLDIEYALSGEERNPESIKTLNMTMDRLQSNQMVFLKEFREMTAEQKDVEKKLKVSRDDRIKNIQDATQNWTAIIRLLNENTDMRDRVGKHIEIMKIAALKEQQKLFELHTYVNHDVDYPILNHESIGEEKED